MRHMATAVGDDCPHTHIGLADMKHTQTQQSTMTTTTNNKEKQRRATMTIIIVIVNNFFINNSRHQSKSVAVHAEHKPTEALARRRP